VLAGTCHQLLTTQTGQCHHTQAGHQARWGRRSLDGVRTRGLLYHKFLDSPVQEQGVGAGSATTDGQSQGMGFGAELS